MSKNKRTRKAKSRRVTLEEDKSFTDFVCPICLEILIEPVQMPCQHELCMGCFKKHVQDTSLTCPVCRLRISIWTRKNAKTNTLVNEERWELIQATFPERVKRRLQGLDDTGEDEQAPKHIIAPDGEVGQEFQEQIKKIQEEEEEVSKASLDYIQKLHEEELIERQRQEELDHAAAQELQKQEMANLGVTLKSPSQHQKELLALLKPKSPMKLRQRAVPNHSASKSKSKVQRNILTSPNHTITSFFKKVNTESNQNCCVLVERTIRAGESSSSSSSSTVTNEERNNLSEDHKLAVSLQNRFDKQREHGKAKEPLRTLNQIDVNTISPIKITKRKIFDEAVMPSKVKRKT